MELAGVSDGCCSICLEVDVEAPADTLGGDGISSLVPLEERGKEDSGVPLVEGDAGGY